MAQQVEPLHEVLHVLGVFRINPPSDAVGGANVCLPTGLPVLELVDLITISEPRGLFELFVLLVTL